jgi:hypothetical protein
MIGINSKLTFSKSFFHLSHVKAPVREGSAPMREFAVLRRMNQFQQISDILLTMCITHSSCASQAIHPLSPPSAPDLNSQLQSS